VKFYLDILIGVQSSDPLNAKIPPIFLLLWQILVVCAQTAIFFNEPVSKQCRIYNLYVEGDLVPPKRARNTGCTGLWRIFSSNKRVPANRKKGFHTIRLPKNDFPSYAYLCTSPALPKQLGSTID